MDKKEAEVVSMERKEAIETLERLLNKMKTDTNVLFSPEVLKALEMAIRCLKVDEMYDLSYEDADW